MRHQYASALNPQAIDRQSGVIRGVSVITQGPALGHGMNVDGITLSQMMHAANQYKGGLKVVDRHVTGGDSVFSTVGTLRNFRIDGPQLRADLYPLKSELSSEKLYEMAETMPDNFGLSVAFSGPSEVIDGSNRARCTEIYNAALVDSPAANPTGLFAAKETLDAAQTGKAMSNPEDYSALSKQFTEYKASSEAQLAKLEKALSDLTDSKANKEFAALQTKVTELSATVEANKTELATRTELAKAIGQSIAKEFAANTGTKPSAGVNPAEVAATPEEKHDAKAYAAIAQKHFATGKVSEVEAHKLAMKEDPAAYQAFRTSGINLKLKA